MIRTIVHSDDIPDSGRRLRVACAFVATAIIALAWGGFYYVLRSTIESDQTRSMQTQTGTIALDTSQIHSPRESLADRLASDPQPDAWLPAGLEYRPPSQLASFHFDSPILLER
ncbi:MAG: hypothetical protein NTU53_05345 [Planctomycetota bacterium]|nr:hypothetical protein [Planctomycetota bacterium]